MCCKPAKAEQKISSNKKDIIIFFRAKIMKIYEKDWIFGKQGFVT